jgi:cytochrome c oxidase subunit 3
VLNLLLTLALGAAFLGVKGYEYHHKFEERLVPGPNFSTEAAASTSHAATLSGHRPTAEAKAGSKVPQVNPKHIELFFSFYFAMTGLHALHMVIGIGVITVLVVAAARGVFDGGHYTPIEMAGLYWHFVDIVWVFLFPLLYLIR